MDAPINWHSCFFLLFGLVTSVFAIAVALTSNVVRMAFYLTLSLGATAGLFFLAGADFVGAMQLLIYVGGTLVLLIFGVMLTAQAPFISMKTRGGDWILAALVGGSLLALLVSTARHVDDWQTATFAASGATAEQHPSAAREEGSAVDASGYSQTATRLGLGLLGLRVDQLERPNAADRLGMGGYLLPFEIVSLHLLIVLLGAAYLARAKRRVRA